MLIISKIEGEITKIYNINKCVSATLKRLCASNDLIIHYETDTTTCYKMALSCLLKTELNSIQHTNHGKLLNLYDIQKIPCAHSKIMFIEGEVTCVSFNKYYSASPSIKDISGQENNVVRQTLNKE